ARRPADLPVARLPQGKGGAQRRVRQAPDQRNLGAAAINRALIAAAFSSILVGAGIAVSRLALAEVPPLTLAMLRYAIGFACLAPFAWRELRSIAPVPPLHSRGRDFAGIALLGSVHFGLLIALLNFGLQRIASA